MIPVDDHCAWCPAIRGEFSAVIPGLRYDLSEDIGRIHVICRPCLRHAIDVLGNNSREFAKWLARWNDLELLIAAAQGGVDGEQEI